MIGVPSRAGAILLLTACLSSVVCYKKKLPMIRKCTNDLCRKNVAHFSTRRVRRYHNTNGHRKREGICSSSTPFMAFAVESPTSIVGRYQRHRLLDNACIARNSVAVHDESDGQQKDEKVLRSVRESLKTNLVKPHLVHASMIHTSAPLTKQQIPMDPPTLVLVLAVSGGCDSVALFHILMALTRLHATDQSDPPGCGEQDITRRREGATNQRYLHLDSDDRAASKDDALRIPCEVHVAHFNHEQRGVNSDGDEAFVKNLCLHGRVTFHRYSWSEISNNNSSDTINGSTFSQDVARKWRRTRLIELLSSLVTIPDNSSAGNDSQRWGAILTAHHRDDAEETILLKLLRGSHLTNLSGMEDRSDGFQINSHERSQLGYFAKPLLGVRKKEIVDYLAAQGFEWREDESNSEDKYKRNKVRNQLIPLLSEIAGSEDALQKRLRHLELQSKDLSNDLAPRVEEYLATMSTESMFLLPQDFHTLTIVEQEALHLWVARVTQRQLILSYEQMHRIRKQLEKIPTRLQWILDVGDCWKIRRNGKALSVSRAVDQNRAGQTTNRCSAQEGASIPWTIFPTQLDSVTYHDPSQMICMHTLHFGKLPHGPSISNMVIKRVKDVNNMVFVPPWRKGRSAIRVREFLRGQKVPLHRRDDCFVLCYSDESLIHALAVYVENTDRWFVHSDFSHVKGALTKVVLGKRVD